jgi:hypothetical protein
MGVTGTTEPGLVPEGAVADTVTVAVARAIDTDGAQEKVSDKEPPAHEAS